jgi:hypothetical protein
MKYLFVPALLGLAMAGCTSSEPQGLVAGAPAVQTAMPSAPTPSFNAASPSAPVLAPQPPLTAQAPIVTTAPAQATSAAGFPPPPACATNPAEAGCAAPARIEKCRTVGSVTTCDVPPDPAADSTHYTN